MVKNDCHNFVMVYNQQIDDTCFGLNNYNINKSLGYKKYIIINRSKALKDLMAVHTFMMRVRMGTSYYSVINKDWLLNPTLQ